MFRRELYRLFEQAVDVKCRFLDPQTPSSAPFTKSNRRSRTPLLGPAADATCVMATIVLAVPLRNFHLLGGRQETGALRYSPEKLF